MLPAALMAPDFDARRSLTPAELVRLDEPAAIFEHLHVDSQGERAYIYTVAGWLDGANVITHQGGCTIGGDVMIVHAEDRDEADQLACLALDDTISLFRGAPPQVNHHNGITVDGLIRPLH
jgi:hypothetical protein